ncbi:MAG: PAS domain-containing sensor histidine kinase [Ktedonobacteraceae bacterium]
MNHHIQTGTQMLTSPIPHANLMFEHMRVGMALYDVQEFRLLAANNRFKQFLQEYLCPGKSYELAIGCPLHTLLPPPKEVARAILIIFRSVVETGEPYETDAFPIPMVGKGVTYWEWTLDPIRDADGTITHLLHSAKDVTEHVRTLQQAEEVYSSLSQATRSIDAELKRLEAINEFLSITSHELRTPITAIQGYAEILQVLAQTQESLNTPRSQRALNSIIDQSKRLTRLIEDLLDLSRVESKRMLLNIEPHNLIQTLVRVIENQAITTKCHVIHLVLDGVTTQETLIGDFDEDRIIQVLNNLINNAVKYSPGQKEIEVGLRFTGENPDKALIWVRDHGIGIAAGELPHIFERFHRASNLDRSISGSGIGLYLVNDLVTQHGGHIRVESIEGKGSTFLITLPLHPVLKS